MTGRMLRNTPWSTVTSLSSFLNQRTFFYLPLCCCYCFVVYVMAVVNKAASWVAHPVLEKAFAYLLTREDETMEKGLQELRRFVGEEGPSVVPNSGLQKFINDRLRSLFQYSETRLLAVQCIDVLMTLPYMEINTQVIMFNNYLCRCVADSPELASVSLNRTPVRADTVRVFWPANT